MSGNKMLFAFKVSTFEEVKDTSIYEKRLIALNLAPCIIDTPRRANPTHFPLG